MSESDASRLDAARPGDGTASQLIPRLGARLSLLLENLNFSRRLEMTYLKGQMRRHLDRAHITLGLDIACGLGNLTQTVAETVATRIFGIDCNRDSIALAREHLRSEDLDFLPADSHFLPFREGAFDFVISICAFEHFNDDRMALAEVNRVLKPGGYFFLTVDSLAHPGVDEEFRRQHTHDCYVHQYYSDTDIRTKLEDARFDVVHSTSLLRSGISSRLSHYGLKTHFGKGYMLVSAFLYPLVLAGEFCSREQRGYKLGVTARKRSSPSA